MWSRFLSLLLADAMEVEVKQLAECLDSQVCQHADRSLAPPLQVLVGVEETDGGDLVVRQYHEVPLAEQISRVLQVDERIRHDHHTHGVVLDAQRGRDVDDVFGVQIPLATGSHGASIGGDDLMDHVVVFLELSRGLPLGNHEDALSLCHDLVDDAFSDLRQLAVDRVGFLVLAVLREGKNRNAYSH